MKLLMFQARRFWFAPFERTLPEAGDAPQAQEIAEAVVAFLHAEAEDEADANGLETKAVKNVKWLAGKRGLRHIVLHSFTHLAESKASPTFAEAFLQSAAERLRRTGYDVTLTPFGWVCEWELAVYGESLAKVYKALGRD
jgi:hypothetical protein